jgi:LacI family transcriptional regulator
LAHEEAHVSRPTIRDLAAAAGVSVTTVNRVIGQPGTVRQETMQRVLDAAREIGFYGVGALQYRVAATRPRHRLGVVIQCPHRMFASSLARAIEAAAASSEDGDVRLTVELLDDLAPERVAARMLEVGAESDALAVLAAEHPLVTDAIETLAAKEVPVVALISPLSARTNVGFVGLDSWKVGRTAAWALARMCRSAGKLGILVGTHRYRCHDIYESGFRSYFREHPGELAVLEPLSTFESDAIARELTEDLLRKHRDLVGLYVSGGGIGGVMAALRDSKYTDKPVTIGHDLMDTTKSGLLDGTLTLILAHPFEAIARETLSATIRAKKSGPEAGSQSVLVPFELYTSENM